MAYENILYADQIINQAGDDLVISSIVLADNAAVLVAAEHKHMLRKVRTVVGDVVTTRYDRSVETGVDENSDPIWSWVAESSRSYTMPTAP